MGHLPILVLTQGDPSGIGPEILLKVLAKSDVGRTWQPLAIIEQTALAALRDTVPEAPWERLVFLDSLPSRSDLATGSLFVIDPVGRDRTVTPGAPTLGDARGAMAALDLGIQLVQTGLGDALVTAPLNKAVVAHHLLPDFRGHTDYLARVAGREKYGDDYLMTFLAPDLRVALLSVHLPLSEALVAVNSDGILRALRCLDRHAEGRFAVAGLNPHAGESGLLGHEEESVIRPAIEAAQREGILVQGPESPDSVFARCRRGEFDWVLALYHDQGLIAVKTASFGGATNWTLGLPFLRTSVDHGTAYEIAGRGVADSQSLSAVVRTTLFLLAERERASLPEALPKSLQTDATIRPPEKLPPRTTLHSEEILMRNTGPSISRYGLDKQGIHTTGTVYWNLPVPMLYEQAICRGEAKLASDGPLVTATGAHTGRAANDKFVVREPSSESDIWWGKVNKPFQQETFDRLLGRIRDHWAKERPFRL